jgi:hypothetical protein
MCSVAAAAGIGAGASVLGMVGQMMGGYMQGSAAEEQYKHKAEMSKKAAGETRLQERAAVRRQRIATRSEVGKQRASLGASGVDPNVGSPLEVQVETGRLGEMDALTLRHNFRMQRWAHLYDAAAARAAQRSAHTAKWFGIASTALNTTSSVANQYAQYRQNQPQSTYQQRRSEMYSNYYSQRKDFRYNWGR